MPTEILVSVIVILVLYSGIFVLLLRGHLSVTSMGVVYVCLIFIIISLALFDYSRDNIYGPMRRYLDIKYAEFNHTAIFSSLILFLTGVSAFLIASLGKPRKFWLVLHWLYISGIFVFLAADEYYAIHEGIARWECYYFVIGGFSAVLSAIVFRRAYPNRNLIYYLMLYGGVGFAGVGGAGIEEFTGEACFDLVTRSACLGTAILEEVIEMLGFTVPLATLLTVVEQSIAKTRWHRLRLVVMASAVLWTGVVVFSYWVQPALENRWLATPVYAQFADKQMTLSGYRISADSIHPGEALRLHLYWYVGATPGRQYGYTVNLIHPQTGESITRINKNISNPGTAGWFPGTTHHLSLPVPIPADVQTPLGVPVVVTVWMRGGGGYETLNPNETTLPTFAGASPILLHLPILSDSIDTEPQHIQRFDFANGAQIEGYDFSHEADGSLRINFYWSTERRIEAQLSQMLHLVHENGADILVFDRHPFSEAFPTFTWFPGMHEVDRWHIVLPDEAVPGTYTVHTGLYDPVSGERVPVTDSAGNQPQSRSVPIAVVSIQPD